METTTVSSKKDGKAVSRKISYSYKKNAESRLVSFAAENFNSDPFTEEAYAYNSKYSFVLKRKSPSDPWVIVSIDILSAGPVPRRISEQVFHFEQSRQRLTVGVHGSSNKCSL
jgi:hypothetical protein